MVLILVLEDIACGVSLSLALSPPPLFFLFFFLLLRFRCYSFIYRFESNTLSLLGAKHQCGPEVEVIPLASINSALVKLAANDLPDGKYRFVLDCGNHPASA